MMRFLPRLPGAFVLVTVSIVLVKVLGLDQELLSNLVYSPQAASLSD